MRKRTYALMCFWIATAIQATAAPETPVERGTLDLCSMDAAQWHFGGELGRRIEANVTNWLLRAPGANPGLIEMFHRRDRHLPYPEPVPWAGEFAGKYLISAVQASRMSDDPSLKPYVAAFVKQLVQSQAEDGYLGPWPRQERLIGRWDLWGHYHCMLGLLMWYDLTGDRAAYDCAVRAANCICDIYVDGNRRPIEAGTPQINLAILHVMGDLYRRTGTERYLMLMHRIEEDMQTDGDWLRQGAQGVPYHKLPGGGTRWESLHIVQGLVEMYRITGQSHYRQAILNLWYSLRDFDRHPSGAFSTHESAYGTVYEEGSIETCCSVAWEALTIDVLKLTGDPTVADELEWTTWNQVLGAQHPSGSWWTYDTPINGVRIPSFHHINFQYRPGTPELNCCSVNAPRGLGMLGEWAVMERGRDVVVNFYGPGRFELARGDGRKLTLIQETDYPAHGAVTLRVVPERPSEFTLALRIPAWSKESMVTLNGRPHGPVPKPGAYLDITRSWSRSDVVQLQFDMTPRHWAGERTRHARAALYTGPLLLAFDAFYNDIETADLPAIDMASVTLKPLPIQTQHGPSRFPPLGLWQCKTDDGSDLILCDFASAGAYGTDYVAWLPAAHVPPPAVALRLPTADAVGRPGPILFCWQWAGKSPYEQELLVATDRDFTDIVLHRKGIDTPYFVANDILEQDGCYYWKVLTVNEDGVTENEGGPRLIRIDAAKGQPLPTLSEDALMVSSALDGDGSPVFGLCEHQQGLLAASDRLDRKNAAVAFDGKTSELRYRLPFFPEEDYSFSAWICPSRVAAQGLQQIFSAWCKGGDDPLRVTLEGSHLFARMENPMGYYSTKGVPLQNGRWVHVAAVKEDVTLTLYLDGVPASSVQTPRRMRSDSTAVGIGFNPMFSGGEHFAGRIDDLAFYARALSSKEIVEAYHRAGDHP